MKNKKALCKTCGHIMLLDPETCSGKCPACGHNAVGFISQYTKTDLLKVILHIGFENKDTSETAEYENL